MLRSIRMIFRRSFAATDTGRRRDRNEDALLADDALGLYVVADGVGGLSSGDVASQEAVQQLHGYIRSSAQMLVECAQRPEADKLEGLRRLLESGVQSACYLVFGMGEQDPDQKGMSTTLSALLVVGDQGITAQVGDSRIYRINQEGELQLTEDHTFINEQKKRGTRVDGAHLKRKRNVITRAVGHRDYVHADTQVFALAQGDLFLLCSDGLHGYLQPGELQTLVAQHAQDQLPQACVELANQRGGTDNISVILVSIE